MLLTTGEQALLASEAPAPIVLTCVLSMKGYTLSKQLVVLCSPLVHLQTRNIYEYGWSLTKLFMCEEVAGDLTDTLLTESPSPLALMPASASIYVWNCHNIQTELNWFLT